MKGKEITLTEISARIDALTVQEYEMEDELRAVRRQKQGLTKILVEAATQMQGRLNAMAKAFPETQPELGLGGQQEPPQPAALA